MGDPPEGAPGAAMRRVLATEAEAREAEQEALSQARAHLEQARADARAIESRAVERIQRMHERAREADARQCEALWAEARERLAELESSMLTEDQLARAAAMVAVWLAGGADDNSSKRGTP